MESIALSWDERPRRYWLARNHLPLSVSERGPGGEVCLVLMLHGTGGSGLLAAEETGLVDFAQRAGFAVAFPEGLPVNPNAPAKFLSNPQRWNDGGTRPGDKLHTDFDDVGFVEAVIRDAVKWTGADPRRVYLTGFSNGAGMAFRFAAERTEWIRAVAPVAGHCWLDAPKPSRPIPTLFLIGDRDPLIPKVEGFVDLPWFPQPVLRPGIDRTLEKWAVGLGYEPTPQRIADAGGIVEAEYGPAFRTVTIPGLGHHWPGGRGLLNPRIGGDPSNALDANARIWEFFQQASRPRQSAVGG